MPRFCIELVLRTNVYTVAIVVRRIDMINCCVCFSNIQ